MEIGVIGSRPRRPIGEERFGREERYQEKKQRPQDDKDWSSKGNQRSDEIPDQGSEVARTQPKRTATRRVVEDQSKAPAIHTIAGNRKSDDDGNLQNPAITAIPLFCTQEVVAIHKELESAVIAPHNIENLWIPITKVEKSQEEIQRLMQVEVPVALQACASLWNETRNMSFWAYIEALLNEGVDGVRIKDIIQYYVNEYPAPCTFSIHDPEAVENLALIHTLALAPTQLWPQESYEGKQQVLWRNRAEIFSEGITQFLQLKGRFPSMETDQIEQTFKEQIRVEMEQRWAHFVEQARGFVIGQITGNVIYDIALSELLKQERFQIGPILAPITIEGQSYCIHLHEWDPCITSKLHTVDSWQANNRKNKLKRKQLQEEMRNLRLLHKITACRSVYPEPVVLTTEEIQSRRDLLQEGRDKNQYDLITMDASPPEVITQALSQWNTDRNFVLFYNLKVRRQEWQLTPPELAPILVEYKKQARHLQGNEILQTSPDIITAMMITNPKNWPATTDEERAHKMQDPVFRQSVERFGWTCTEIAGIYGRYPEWETGSPDPEKEEHLREYIAAREQAAAEHMGLTEPTDYPLWTFIVCTLFSNAVPSPDEIYQLPEGANLTLAPKTCRHTDRVEENGRGESNSQEEHRNEDSDSAGNNDEWESAEEFDSAPEDPENPPEPPADPDPEPPQEPAHQEDFETKLRNILRRRNPEEVQTGILQLMEEHVPTDPVPGSLDTSIADYLASSESRLWPKPQAGRCPFDEECDRVFPTPGSLRTHMVQRHQLDITKTRDEIHIMLQILMEREIKGIEIRENGEICLRENEQYVNAPLLCPFCDYLACRDAQYAPHLAKCHWRQMRDAEQIGIFWAKLKHMMKTRRPFPTILEVLGEHRAHRCGHCKTLRANVENMRQHLSCAHKGQDQRQFEIVTHTYLIEEMQGDDIMNAPVQEDYAEEETQEEPTIVPIEGRLLDIPEEAYQQLEEDGISHTMFDMCIRRNDKRRYRLYGGQAC